uniref:Uncharacterized protein n=1 Tax=Rhizophora mucronata TaxID=61149 RepID=A0A2P2QDM3_RHIMU
MPGTTHRHDRNWRVQSELSPCSLTKNTIT